MGLRGYGDNDLGPAFVEDMLRIKVAGPSGLYLSNVDLLGLISNPSEEQVDDNMETVHKVGRLLRREATHRHTSRRTSRQRHRQPKRYPEVQAV